MNSAPDTVLNKADEKIETTRQEQRTELNAEILELGKVSDTRGGFFGAKTDVGAGFIAY